MNRRNFVRLAGGGAVFAAGAAAAGAYVLRSGFPEQAVEAWQGPGDIADARQRAVAYAITAPNPHNLQPWLVDLREPGIVTVYTDPERVLPETDPFGRQILIGHGAFLELLVIALAEEGLRSDVSLWPQGELPADLKAWDRRPIARIRTSPGAGRDPLFAQILKRHTPKTDFDVTRAVAPATLQALVAAHRSDASKVEGTVDETKLPALRQLCLDAGQIEIATPATALESLRLMRVGPQEILRHRDGISINNAVPRVFAAVGLFDRTQAAPVGSPAYEQALQYFRGHTRSAMGFVWLATPGSSRTRQVEAGRAYVRLQLKATELGVGLHPMSQALQEFKEMAPLYERAHRLLLGRAAPRSAEDPTVQMLCRVGYTPQPAPAAPRRALQGFIV